MVHRVEDYFKNGPLKVLDDLPAAVLFTDSDETVLHSNAVCQEFFGLSKDSLLGTRYSELVNASRAESKGRLNDESLQIGVEIAGQQYNIIVHSRSVGKDLIFRVIQDITKVLSDVEELRAEVKRLQHTMEGLLGDSHVLPVCCVCKKVRTKDGGWVTPTEGFVLDDNMSITHGLCPPCARKYIDDNLPEYEEERR